MCIMERRRGILYLEVKIICYKLTCLKISHKKRKISDILSNELFPYMVVLTLNKLDYYINIRVQGLAPVCEAARFGWASLLLLLLL